MKDKSADKGQLVHHFISLFSDSPDPVAILGIEGDVISSNDSFNHLLSGVNGANKPKNLKGLIHKDDLPLFLAFTDDLHKSKQAMMNCHMFSSENKTFDAFIRSYLLSETMIFVHIMDVSFESKKREEESQKKWIDYFERLFANSKDIMNLFSMTQRRILRWNPQASIAMGYTEEELENVPIEQIYPPEELLKLGGTFQRLAETGFAEEKLKIYNSKKELKDIWTRSFVIQTEPEVLCLVSTIDITQEKERERNLLKETRLAALGEASASLAHEINNSLQSIQFNLYLLKEEKIRLPEDCFNRLEKIEKNLTHISSVVRNIQNYTHFSRAGRTKVFLSSLVEGALQILEGYMNSRQIEVTCEIDRNLPPVAINPNQVQQILLIFIKNAVQAMSTTPQRKLDITAHVDGHNVKLLLKDTGCGIPPEVSKQMFETFVTTKAMGVGVGLGLSVAKKLALANKVDLSFTSKVGVGTEFCLLFKAEEEDGSVKEASKVLLYVDDKDSLFPSFEEALASKNITVIRAQTARDAIKILVDNQVDLVMCAEKMYPVSGVGFIKEVVNIFSGPICMLRDNSQLSAGAAAFLEANTAVQTLNYPCEIDEFSKKIADMSKIKRKEEVAYDGKK